MLRTQQTRPAGVARSWLALMAAILAALFLNCLAHPQFANPDSTLLLYVAGEVLDGKVPYVDIIETNPPLIVYLNIVPAALARWTGLDPMLALNLCVLGALALSLWLASRALRLFASLDGFERGATLAVWTVLSALIYMMDEASQKEHLFLLAFFPWMLLRLARADAAGGGGADDRPAAKPSAWLAAAAGLAAGVGCSIKPHFFLAAAAVEVMALAGRRRWRTLFEPENLWLAAVPLLYVAHWWAVPSAMRKAYLGFWAPAMVAKYGAFNQSRSAMAKDFVRPSDLTGLFALPFLGLAAWLGLRRPRRLWLLSGTSALLFYAGLAIFLAQGKGWHYQNLPTLCFFVLCMAFVFLQARQWVGSEEDGGAMRRAMERWAFGVGILFLLLTMAFAHYNKPGRYRAAFADYIEQHTRPGETVLMFYQFTGRAFPSVVQAGRRLGSRYAQSFPVAFAYYDGHRSSGPPYHSREQMDPVERRYLDDLEEDMRQRRPALILIPTTPGDVALASTFRYGDYLTHVGWSARWLPLYREIPAPGGWRAWRRK